MRRKRGREGEGGGSGGPAKKMMMRLRSATRLSAYGLVHQLFPCSQVGRDECVELAVVDMEGIGHWTLDVGRWTLHIGQVASLTIHVPQVYLDNDDFQHSHFKFIEDHSRNISIIMLSKRKVQ
jgi:hypothetical protein